MESLNVLIVEDEPIVALDIESYLSSIGCNVLGICADAKETITILKNSDINVVIMDIYLKGDIDGIELAAIIKDNYEDIKVIFLTANNDDYNIDRVALIEPVSYLTKPFNRQELLASIKIAKAKLENQDNKDIDALELDEEYSFDINDKFLYCCGELIHLTKKESDLLSLFIKNKNNLVSNYVIENELWPDKEANANTIRTLVKRLREKLKHKFIKTVPARGYIFELA